MSDVAEFVILLAEDDRDQVFLIQRAFQQLKMAGPPIVVRDGDETIDYLEGNGKFADRQRHPLPSLLLLDLKMPKKDGFEVLQWVRGSRRFRNLPVVILTSSNESVDIDRAYALGVNSYLIKPVRFSDLLELIKTLSVYWRTLNRSRKLQPPPSPGGAASV